MAIQLCSNCSEQTTSKNYCKDCSTAEKRKVMAEENKKIWEENEKKGFNNPLKTNLKTL